MAGFRLCCISDALGPPPLKRAVSSACMPRLSKILEGLELFHVSFFCLGFLALVLVWAVYSLWRPSAKNAPPGFQFAQRHICALGFAAMLLLFLLAFVFRSFSSK